MNESAGRQGAASAGRQDAPAGTHWKNRPNILYTGVVGDLDFPGMGFFATPTARTIVSRVNTFKGGVQHRNKHYLPPRTKYFFYRGIRVTILAPGPLDTL